VTPRLEIWGIDGLPEVEAGDDVAALLVRANAGLHDGDVIVVTSKIVSKAQGRLVEGTRADHLEAETARLVARRGDTAIVETHHGFVMAAAGIDGSNVPSGHVALLPIDPDAAARDIRIGLQDALRVDVAVIISDTMGRPWRDGVIDTAIGAAGLDVIWDLRGQHDLSGHLLEATVVAIADELASAADLAKGKLGNSPVAIIRGFPFTRNDPDAGARPLIRSAADDMFRLGTREAMLQVVADSTPTGGSGGPVDREIVLGAVTRLGGVDVVVDVAADGRTITVAGDPLTAGHTLGRLAASLAADGLRATAPVATETGATMTVHAMAGD
jgi:coenzyme F420-0:L-glutamate ligase/coenzyme F420-1:gamma-L-glutamate ligase